MNLAFLKFALCCGVLLAISGCNFIRNDNLNQAIARGETESVRKAIARGVDVNGRGMHAVTPLMTAAGGTVGDMQVTRSTRSRREWTHHSGSVSMSAWRSWIDAPLIRSKSYGNSQAPPSIFAAILPC